MRWRLTVMIKTVHGYCLRDRQEVSFRYFFRLAEADGPLLDHTMYNIRTLNNYINIFSIHR